MRQASYQSGSVTFDPRSRSWNFRWTDRTTGKRRSVRLGGKELNKTKALAAAESYRAKANIFTVAAKPKLADVIARFEEQKMPLLTHKSQATYKYRLNCYIKPIWGKLELDSIKPFAIMDDFNRIPLGSGTKGGIRNTLHRLLECAMLWEMMESKRNPISHVHIVGSTLREKEPTVLEVAEFGRLIEYLKEPLRTMAIFAVATGLRCCEMCGLKWSDVDFAAAQFTVRRNITGGHEGKVKTPGSKATLPLDPVLSDLLEAWRSKSNYTKDTDWIWASDYVDGEKPLHGWALQNTYIKPAAEAAGLGPVGWHTFRHTYRTWLDEAGTPLGVIQGLMRHAKIATTMNVYGKAMPKPKREAQGNVVRMVLPALALAAKA